MAILNVQEKRESSEPTLNYIYRGDGHEHEIELVEMIGGDNMLSFDPVFRGPTGAIEGVDVSMLAEQFEQFTNSNYKGNGNKTYIHFMLSLAPGETLNNEEWNNALKDELIPALGLSSDAPWHAAKHKDTQNEHAHVIASLVDPKTGMLIDTQNMAKKAFDAVRRIEHKYGLTILENPGSTFGNHFSEKDIAVASKLSQVQTGSMTAREACVVKDRAAIIRARFKSIRSAHDGRMPTTFSSLSIELYKKGVEVKASENNQGGLNLVYRLKDDDTWISASKVGASTYTFKALTEKFNVNYNADRDNPMLGIGDKTKQMTLSFSFNVSHKQYKNLKTAGRLQRAATRSSDDSHRVEYRIGMTEQQKRMMHMMKLIQAIISSLFGKKTSSEIEFEDFMYKMHLDELRQLKQHNQMQKEYIEQLEEMEKSRLNDNALDIPRVINVSKMTDDEIMNEIDKETDWRKEDSSEHILSL